MSKGILDYFDVLSSENIANIVTKGLNRSKTEYFTIAMGLVETMIKGEC